MRKLESVGDLMDALRERHGWPSDYRIAKELGLPQTTVSGWRSGQKVPGDGHSLTIAEWLDVSPAVVLVVCARARASETAARKAWSIVADQLARAGITSIAGILLATTVCEPAKADALPESVY